MIRHLIITNFYSFGKKQEISFCVNGNAPLTLDYVKTNFDDRISKLNFIFGPNASGKTNTLKILSFLDFFISGSAQEKPEEKIPFDCFAFASKYANQPSQIEVEFLHGSTVYYYSVAFTEDQVIAESLKEKNEGKYIKYIFSKKWNKTLKSYMIHTKLFGKNESIVRALSRKNASIVSIGAQLNNTKCQSIAEYWDKTVTNVGMYGKTSHDRWGEIEEAAKYFYAHNEEKLLADRLLSEFDLGLSEMKIEKKQRKDRSDKTVDDYLLFGVHEIGKNHYPWPFYSESRGTQNLFVLLRDILPVLKNGGVVVYDDIEEGLHPVMMPKIVELFASPKWNPKNAQLIASTHNIQMFDRLDMYQIFLTEKDQKGQTDIWRLDEVDDIRSDSNYLKKYLAGAYGGRPNV